jgi:hypothetical protein
MQSRHFRRVGLTFGALLAAVLFFMGGAALRLLMGPISLGPFADAIEDAVNGSLTGLVVRFDQAVLEWSREDGQINLVILGTNVFDASGRIVAQAPKADLDFDAASIFSGKIALKRFALLGVQLTARRDVSGALKLGFGASPSDVDLYRVIRETLENGQGGESSLETFSIGDARLAFRDDITGLFIVSPDVGFVIENKGGVFTASLDAAIEISGALAHVSATAVLNEAGMPSDGTLIVTGLDLAAVAANSPQFLVLAPYVLETDLTAQYRLGDNGRVAETSFTLSGLGEIALEGIAKRYQIDDFSLQATYTAADSRIVIDNAHAAGPSGSADLSGIVGLNWNDTGLAGLSLDIQAEAVRLADAELFSEPLDLDTVVVSAEYDIAARDILWEQLRLSGRGLDAEFEGRTSFPEGLSPGLTLTGTIGRLSVADALHVWPLIVGRGARGWIADNVHDGFLGPLGLATDIAPGMLDAGALPAGAISLAFPVENLSANYMRGLTPVSELQGEGSLSGNVFRLSATSGKIGPLSITGGIVEIPDLHLPHPPGHIMASVAGSMKDVLTLIDMEPLGYPTRFRVNPQDVTGTALVDLDIQLPMKRGLLIEEVQIAVSTVTDGLGLPVQAGRVLSDGDATIFVDNDHLTAEGMGALNGVPMQFAWEEIFEAEADAMTTRVDVVGTLDEDGRRSLRLALPEWLTGPIAMTASFIGRRFDFDRAEIRADLSATAADLEAINLVKEPGQALLGSGIIEFVEGGGLHIREMQATGSGIALEGELDLDPTGRLIAASLPSVRYGVHGDLALTLDAPEGAIPSWRITGRGMDASRLFAEKEVPGVEQYSAPDIFEEEEAPIAPVSVIATLDEIFIRDGVVLRGVNFRFAIAEGERLTDFHLDATGIQDAAITARFNTAADGSRYLNLASDNAGVFVHTFTGFTSLQGGELAIDASFPAPAAEGMPLPSQDYSGTIRITDFSVIDQPFMARLFSIGSLDGPLRLLQDDGIPFAELEAPFVASGGKLALRDGVASGMAMGVSFQGMIDRDRDTIDINGSLVPVYGLNSMLGALPIVGDLLVSKDGEGIIGMTYAARGELDEPQVLVNPLSVLTPGIFRRIFEFGGPPAEFGPTAVAPAVPPPGATQTE